MNSEDLKYYKEPLFLTYSFLDLNNNPVPSHILQIFQDLAGVHSGKLGCGYNDLISKDLIWILDKVRYRQLKPLPYETLTGVTWTHRREVLEFNREFEISDSKGEVCIEATSKWCVANVKTRKLVIPRFDYPLSDCSDEKLLGDSYDLVPHFETKDLQPSLVHKVLYTDLDHNKHMNNTNYASLVVNSIPQMEEFKIEEMQIHFLKESSLGEEISVFSQKDAQGNWLTLGLKSDHSCAFDAKTVLKHI